LHNILYHLEKYSTLFQEEQCKTPDIPSMILGDSPIPETTISDSESMCSNNVTMTDANQGNSSDDFSVRKLCLNTKIILNIFNKYANGKSQFHELADFSL
jgi:hypothetical protein